MRDSAAATATTGPAAGRPLRILGGALPELALLAVLAVLWLLTGGLRPAPPGELGPAWWPRLLIILFGLCVLGQMGRKALTVGSPGRPGDTDPAPDGEEPRPFDARRAVVAVAAIVGYVLAAIYLGYLIATTAFVVAFLLLAGRRTVAIDAAVGVGAALAFSFVFLKVVYIAVPSGVGAFDAFTVWVYGLIGIY
jgi:putative tricarboxylic transport membrane protein